MSGVFALKDRPGEDEEAIAIGDRDRTRSFPIAWHFPFSDRREANARTPVFYRSATEDVKAEFVSDPDKKPGIRQIARRDLDIKETCVLDERLAVTVFVSRFLVERLHCGPHAVLCEAFSATGYSHVQVIVSRGVHPGIGFADNGRPAATAQKADVFHDKFLRAELERQDGGTVLTRCVEPAQFGLPHFLFPVAPGCRGKGLFVGFAPLA